MNEAKKFEPKAQGLMTGSATVGATSSTIHHGNSRERGAVIAQTDDLVRLADRLQILREKMGNDLSPRECEHRCGDCDQIPHTTFDRIIVNNHHINCLTEFVDDLISRFQP